MSESTNLKSSNNKNTSSRDESRQQSQPTQTINQQLVTTPSKFLPIDTYDECFSSHQKTSSCASKQTPKAIVTVHKSQFSQVATTNNSWVQLPSSISQPANIHVRGYTFGDFLPVVLMPNDSNVTKQSGSSIAHPKLSHQEDVARKLAEIILTIHESKQFVSYERVQNELFYYFRVNSWKELGVNPAELNPLVHLTYRLQKVTFYMQIFERVCMLCTLHELGPLLAQFLNVSTYEHAYLGPLYENPTVKQMFDYSPTYPHQPIPPITSGDVISMFLDFQARYKGILDFDKFRDELVIRYRLRTQKELGLYCRSFPFLVEVSKFVQRNWFGHCTAMQIKAKEELTNMIAGRLSELQQVMAGEFGLSSYNKKKSPIAVFNHLSSIVEKYLSIVPEQSMAYVMLIHLRQNKILQWLLNISIYLGTIETPDTFVTELEKILREQSDNLRLQILMKFYHWLPYDSSIGQMEYRRLQAMIQQQQYVSPAYQNLTPTNVSNPLLSTAQKRPTLSVTLKQFCMDLFDILINYEKPLTVRQLLDIEKRLCVMYNVNSFSAFNFSEDDIDDIDINLVSFLNIHQMVIDPNQELSVYGYNVSETDRQELFEFVNQVTESNGDKQSMFSDIIQFDINSNSVDPGISADNLSILEKAVVRKFGGLLGFRTGTNILRKAKQSQMKNVCSIIRFEESLLDFNYLDRIDTCPSISITNEHQLCQFILQCPIMINLYTWLQWTYFFEPKFGDLKSFIKRYKYSLQHLLLLEISNHEILRLPINATLKSFEDELQSLDVRSAVGHLCALITYDYGLTTRVPFSVYRTSIRTWFIHLQSLSMLPDSNIEPMQYILEFLTHLPTLIGQARIIQELILGPLDDVFWTGGVNQISTRTRIWELADEKQRNKLEIWGHTLDINAWKNNSKWSGQFSTVADHKSVIRLAEKKLTTNDPIVKNNDSIPTEIQTASMILSSNHQLSSISTEIKNENKSESCQTAFQHIESIRRGFGVDSGLDANGQSIVNNYQGMLERSLQKLSKDLYSEQGHFVLELIQNADDNQYAPDRLPTLRFVLSDKRILVCNNEIGFQQDNINAICDVGASTKGKHKQGYAGHKGIGFKSVFMVSNCPEIHSRDYHFCFDTADGTQQIGYIRPIWLHTYDEVLPSADEWTTCIRLPIQRGSRIEENFDNIQGKLLLFLNRLRRIEIIDQRTSTDNNEHSRTFLRIDHADGKIIELQEKTVNETIIKSFWLVIKKVLIVPEDIKEKLREVKCDVHSTTIAIAYPLSGLHQTVQQLPSAQPLFAYLPLRPYGFRFILQADFEIPVTRQEVLHDNIWNEWLKSEMIQLLPLAYTQFQILPDLLTSSLPQSEIGSHLTTIQVLIYFLKLIPTRNELDPYFNAFVDKSMKSLMGIIKLPVSREDACGQTHIEWVQPSQCVLVKDSFIRKVVPQDLLLSHFNMYYVPEQLALECNERTLIKLGCASLKFSSIIRLVKELYSQQEREHSTKTSSIEQIAQWLLCIDYILQEEQEMEQSRSGHRGRVETTTITELKQLKIIPLSGQSRLVSMEEYKEKVVLLPLSKTVAYKKPFKIILDDLPRLDERLFEYIEDKFPRRYESLKNLLKNLGMIDNPKIKDIYRLHIRPTLLDLPRWSTTSDAVLVAFLLCIYTYFDQFESELDQLQKLMVIKTRSGTFIRLDTPCVTVHLTSAYGCTKSLESLVTPKHEFTFISDDYINNYRTELFHTKDEINSFVRFLSRLNITEFLQINITDTHFINVSQLQNTQWAYLIPELEETIRQPFVIEDCICNEFNTLVLPSGNSVVDVDLCSKLLIYLDRYHKALSRYYTASIILTDQIKYGRRHTQQYIPSTFCLSLRQQTWIPIENGKLAKPDDVYCLDPRSETLFFHCYVLHLDQARLSLKDREFMLNILGLKEHVLPMTMFELFMKWSCALDRDTLWTLVHEINQSDIIQCALPATFHQECYDTIDNISRIYRFLIGDKDIFNILCHFRLWPIVFIPRNSNTGDFLFAHQVYWHDSTSLLSNLNNINLPHSTHRIAIQQYYGNDAELKTFFVEKLQIVSEPMLDDYLPLLLQLINVNDTWRLIEVMVRLSFEQNRQSEIKEQLYNLPFIPCLGMHSKRAKYAEKPLYPHDDDIANSLANTLSIIQLPDWTMSSKFKNDFCSLFEIPNLIDVIQVQVHVDNEQLSIDIFNFYYDSIEIIQNFLLSKSFISNERSQYLASTFTRMHFACVDKIQLSYHYQTNTLRTDLCDSHIDEQTGRFYILKKFEKSEKRHIQTMANYIVQDRVAREGLIKFMMQLSRVYQNEGQQGLKKQRDGIVTQEYDHKWILPNIYMTPSLPSLSNESIHINNEPIVIAPEAIERVMNEPLPERKPRCQATKTERNKNKNPICIPAKANSNESTDAKPHLTKQGQTRDSFNDSNSNHPSSDLVSESPSENPYNNNTTINEENIKQNRASVRKHQMCTATIDYSNSTSVEEATFQGIRIYTLTGSNPRQLPLSSMKINPNDEEVDSTIGRQGEEIVFRFLKRKHPKTQIEWMNAEKESGLPYDIRIRKQNNKEFELIEVKTTRNEDQHIFQISIGEIKYLLKNSMNYHIYRVYYSDNPDSTKIAVLENIKYHFEQKHLKLFMAIKQLADEQDE